MDIISNEVVGYWAALVSTLHQRGLLRDRPQQGGKILPESDAILLPDRVIFALDLQRLGGIPREKWLDPVLWEQWQAALRGRRCFVSDGGGLAICVAREPGEHVKRLPRVIPLDLESLPEKPYTVTLGHTRRGPVTLDLSGKHRAILIGGTSGGGKTNLMQALILQLAAKHDPQEVQFAIVDTKEVDFGTTFTRLPHLFAPIAHDLEEAACLIEAVEAERLRRQAVMAQAGVADWRKTQGLPLLLLVVDEAADFAKTAAMDTLVEVARKGRAFGISVVVGTQNPTSKVIDAQVKANLPTAIAFQTRTDVESRVILGKSGAENLTRPGLALSFLSQRWQTIQTLRVDPEVMVDLAAPPRPALSGIEAALVAYAVHSLDGAFKINALADAHRGSISRRQLLKLGRQWEARGWLTKPAHATAPRRVTPELLAMLGPTQTDEGGSREPGAPGGSTRAQGVPGGDPGEIEAVPGVVLGWYQGAGD
jgi:hypothetical protein